MAKSNKAKALRNTAARIANLTNVRKAAFNSGTSRNALLTATFAALGAKPVLALYNATRGELVVGLMAAYLVRKGSNVEPEALMADCRKKVTDYQGHGGTAKLRPGSLGRRSKLEEDAYASARVLVSGVMKDSRVTVPVKSGTGSSGRKPQPSKAKAANDTKPVVRKYADKAALVAYLALQGSAMLATINKNAKLAPNEAKSAVQDFVAAIKKID